MARLSDIIEEILKEMIEQNDGYIEITRSELANQVNCVPSQVTYVLATRFTNNHGYLVESRRGGGGWIRIRRVSLDDPSSYMMHALNGMGKSLSQHQAEVMIRNFLDYEVIKERESRLLHSAITDRSLSKAPVGQRDLIRMMIFKNMLTSLIVD